MTDARISTGLPGHHKTKKLIRRLGPGAGWHLVCLYLWAAANKPDGVLDGMTAEDIELAIDWAGENDAFVRELVAVGFLDGEEGAYTIHDWADHNPWVNGSELRSARAKWNAVKRHHGAREADRQVPEYAAVRNADSTGKDAGSTGNDANSTKKGASSKKRGSDDEGGSAPPADAASTENDAGSNAPSPSPSPSPSPKATAGTTHTTVARDDAEPPTTPPGVCTPAGLAAAALNRAGVRVTSQNPNLIAAMTEGVTTADLLELHRVYPDKPAAYLIATARRQRAEIAAPIPPGASHAASHPGRRLSAVERVEANIRANRIRRGELTPDDAIDGEATRVPR